MKQNEFLSALTYWAEGEDRSTALLVEAVTAAILLKLNPPARGDDVVSVSLSTRDLEELFETHHFESRYDAGGEMTIFLTPLSVRRDVERGDT